jgi:myosin heavy subunit
MGISDEDMGSIWRVISASLLFGNMEFKQERNSDQATLPDNTVAQKASFSNFKVREGVRNFSLKSLGIFSSKSK